jgi:hypothetical protein
VAGRCKSNSVVYAWTPSWASFGQSLVTDMDNIFSLNLKPDLGRRISLFMADIYDFSRPINHSNIYKAAPQELNIRTHGSQLTSKNFLTSAEPLRRSLPCRRLIAVTLNVQRGPAGRTARRQPVLGHQSCSFCSGISVLSRARLLFAALSICRYLWLACQQFRHGRQHAAPSYESNGTETAPLGGEP